MKFKNISDSSRYFQLGKGGQQVAQNEIATVAFSLYLGPNEEARIFNQLLQYEEEGVIEILEGPNGVKYTGKKSVAASGWFLVTGTVSNEDTVTIGSEVYQISNDDTYGGNIPVTVSDLTSTTGVAEALTEAIAENSDYVKVVNVDSHVVLTALEEGPSGNGIALDTSSAQITASGSELAGGAFGGVSVKTVITTEVTDVDQTAGKLVLNTGLDSITSFILQAIDGDGAIKSGVGNIVVEGGLVIVDAGGSSGVEENDVVTLVVVA